MKILMGSQLAEFLGAELVGPDRPVTSIAPVDRLVPDCLGFMNRLAMDEDTRAGATLIVPLDMPLSEDSANSYIRVADPRLALARVVDRHFSQKPEPVRAASAVVSPAASIGKDCAIGEFAVIEEDVVLGDGCVIGHHAVLAKGTVLGANCVIGPHSVLGVDGLSCPRDENGVPVPIRHLGRLVLGDNVEVGPSCCLQRGTLAETRVGDNVKMSTRVNVGHNCAVGENTILTSGVCLSGGSTVGKGCFLGVNTSVKELVRIGDNVVVGIHSLVIRNVPSNTTVMGLESLSLKNLNKFKLRCHYRET